ncbi:UNVERIFIED_CONTAM: hypothetical protein GTU68_060110 [Idotea baltica]|nr:hypothetical protein [Idotea baltica]
MKVLISTRKIMTGTHLCIWLL